VRDTIAADGRCAVQFEMASTVAEQVAGKPGVVRFLLLPARRCVMIDGEGPAGEAAFAPRMPGLYSTAWTLRFALKRRGVVTKVGPLEGLWWTVDGATDLDVIFADGRLDGRDTWRWTLFIGLPDEATDAELDAALAAGRSKLETPYAANLRIESLEEGEAAQVLHLGPYSAERPSIERLHAAIAAAGLRPRDRHHEIYLGDPRRGDPAKVKTILRHPVAPAG
jgi:hypothetical protein